MTSRILPFLLLAILLCGSSAAQDTSGYHFDPVVANAASPVRDQARSGTCWSFATCSFLESEILRLGGPETDLSEMFFVYHAYLRKAEMQQRYRGKANFGPGGQAHDVMQTIREDGMMPESAFSGLACDTFHNHAELDVALNGLTRALTTSREAPVHLDAAVGAILGVYIGLPPAAFEFDGRRMTAKEYASTLPIDPDDYVELTSYAHHPFFGTFVLEVPDNWSFDNYYNLPLDELIRTMTHALTAGFTISWDGDVSDRGFSHKHGVAIVPAEGREPSFGAPSAESLVDQAARQAAFDGFETTDDHLMHITGIVTDQEGTTYFTTKNSWGTGKNDSGGYLQMSESFIRLNTIAIMLHKEAIPRDLRRKLGL